jgi:hypothetical protein
LFFTIVKITIGFVLAVGFAFILATIFQCKPISGAWDKSSSPTCSNGNTIIYIGSGFGIAQDLLILFLPVPELLALQMTTKKKLNVLGMFSIGGL